MDTFLEERPDEFYVTVAEQFVKDYQDALDSVRKNLSIYMDNSAMSALTNHPTPPPPVFSHGTSSDDKKLDELGFRHEQQVAEVVHILEYMVDDYLMRPGVCYVQEIESTVEQFVNQLQRATGSYVVKSGFSPYGNESPDADYVPMVHRFQQMHLRAADCCPDGEGGEAQLKEIAKKEII